MNIYLDIYRHIYRLYLTLTQAPFASLSKDCRHMCLKSGAHMWASTYSRGGGHGRREGVLQTAQLQRRTTPILLLILARASTTIEPSPLPASPTELPSVYSPSTPFPRLSRYFSSTSIRLSCFHTSDQEVSTRTCMHELAHRHTYMYR